jgi:hypothetical protein
LAPCYCLGVERPLLLLTWSLREFPARSKGVWKSEALSLLFACSALVFSQLCGRLRATSAAKLDAATLHLVQRPDEFMAEEQVLVTHARGGLKSGVWANVVFKSFRGPAKPIVFKELGLQVDIPKALNQLAGGQLKLALRCTHFPYDVWSAQSAATPTDLVVGGVLQVEFVYLPPPPKTVKGMLMRPSSVLGAALQRYPYGNEHGAAAVTAPLKVHLHVPAGVFLVPAAADRRVLHWDPAGLAWTADGVDQVRPHTKTRGPRGPRPHAPLL